MAATGYVGTVNIPGSANSVRMDELLSTIASLVGWMPSKVTWGTASQQGYARRESDRTLFDSIVHDNGLPRWKEKWSLDAGLREYVEWCQTNFKKEVAA